MSENKYRVESGLKLIRIARIGRRIGENEGRVESGLNDPDFGTLTITR